MKAKRLLFLTLMALCATSAWAYNFSAVAPSGQTLYYNIVGDEAQVTFQNSSSPYYSTYPTGSLVIPNSVVYGGVSYTVTSIGEYAFYNCSGLTSVTIPNSVTSIGNSAFSNCSGLTSVTIPNSVTSIGGSAFRFCSGLTSVNYTGTIAQWCSINFSTLSSNPASYSHTLSINGSPLTNLVIPEGVTEIKEYAFYSCRGLTSVTIGNSVTSIGDEAFYGCSGLTSVTIPNSVTSIGNSAFEGCSGLTSVTIPNSVTSIGYYAFNVCSGLTSVTIGNSVTSIGTYAFNGCSNLTEIWLKPTTPPSLGNASPLGAETVPLVVPHNSYNAYTSAGASYTNHPIYRDSIIVEALVNDTLRGYVTGGDTVLAYPCDNVTVTLTATATANYGYHFVRWDDNSTDNPRHIVTNSGITRTAIFDFNKYTITLQADTSIHGSCNGGGSYNYLSERTIQANANYGYHFTHWQDGSTDNPRTVLLTQDTSFIAYYERNTYTLTFQSADTNKGIVNTVSVTGEYLDTTMLIDAIAAPHYHFVRWNDNNTENPRRFVIDNNRTYTAYFSIDVHDVSVQVDHIAHGTVDGSGSREYGQPITVSATPYSGYHFTHWQDGNTDNPRTVLLTQDTSFTALFGKNIYTITAISCDTVKGTVNGNTSIEYLDSVAITAIPNYGYHFTAWNDGNTDNPRTIVATRDSVFTASFGHNQYTIILEVDTNIHGTVVGGGSYNYMSEQTITAMANYGYHFTAWSDGDTNNPRTVLLTQDTSFIAYYDRNTYTLTFQSADTNKGIVNTVSVTGEYLDTTILIDAIAIPHYHFVRWNDNNTENPRRFVIDNNRTYTAYFSNDVHNVSVQVDHIAHGTVDGSGSREYGQPITVSATPYSGYRFTHWSNGSTYNPYTFAVLEDKNLTAVFIADGEPWQDTVVVYDTLYVDVPYTVHDTTYINVHDTTYIDVPYAVHDTTYIDVPYAVHDTTYIDVHDTTYIDVPYAVHDTTYINVHDTTTVTDTVTHYIYDTTIVHDTTLVTDTLWLTQYDTIWLHDTIIIHDTLVVGADEVDALNAKIYTSHGQIVVEGTEDNTVWLYDINGRILATKQDEYSALCFDVPASGTYLIKVGHHPARRVVVIR